MLDLSLLIGVLARLLFFRKMAASMCTAHCTTLQQAKRFLIACRDDPRHPVDTTRIQALSGENRAVFIFPLKLFCYHPYHRMESAGRLAYATPSLKLDSSGRPFLGGDRAVLYITFLVGL